MAGEAPRVAEAWIEIKARKARDFDTDVRRMGADAGKEYQQAFDRESAKASASSRAQRIAEARRQGAEIGDAAGREAGQRTTRGITETLARNRGRRERDGEEIGASLGNGANRSFRSRFIRGIRTTSDSAGKILESGIYRGLNRGFRRGLLGAAAIGALTASASGLGSIISGTVAAVVQLSGALAVLPAVGVAAGIGLAAVKIGVHDVGDALSNSGDPKKYAESLKKLSPAARDFTKAVVRLKPELKALRNSVQEGLFKGLAREVTDLGSRYIPILQTGLTKVAGAFNAAAKDVGNFLDTAATGKQVSGIFDNVAKAGNRLAPAFRPAVAALLDIVDVGSTFLPGFANRVTDLSKRFQVFIAKAKDSGSLKDFIQGGISGFKELGGALGQAGRIIGGIFKAGGSANTSPLQTFSGILKSIADTVNTPAFQTGLSHFFDAIAVAGAGVADKMAQLGDALVALEPTISRIVEGSGVALPSILETIAKAATAAAPVLNTLGDAFVAIAPHAGPLVLALIGLKVALFGIAKATAVLEAITVLRGRILVLGEAALATRLRMLSLATSLRGVGLASAAARVETIAATSAIKLLGAAFAVVAVAAAADYFGDFIGKAAAATVSAKGLSDSLTAFGNGGNLGKSGLELFSSGMGPFRREAEDTSEALKKFGINAYNALDQGWDARLGRWQSFGAAQSEFKKQTEQLDGAFSQMAKNGNLDTASTAFSKFIKAGVDAGVPVASLKAAFPQFTAAVAASGGTVDTTTGKVRTLTLSLGALIGATDEYAGRTLNAREAARNYEASLDAANEALKRNGGSLDITTAKGRENAASLDAIAAAGIASAKVFAGDGPDAQSRFRDSLLKTRADLIKTGKNFRGGEEAAKRLADRILRIPSAASVRVSTPGIDRAIARLGDLIVQINRVAGRTFRYTIKQVFESEGRRDKATAGRAPDVPGVTGMTGGLFSSGVIRRAEGGLIDPRLGAPRQDNVPAWLSGGEFIVNAFATAQPGVLGLLRKINATNQYPQRLASGGSVRRASAGLNDITASTPARMTRIETVRSQPTAPAGPAGDMAATIAEAVAAAVAREIRGLKIVMQDGVLAGAVSREVGRSF